MCDGRGPVRMVRMPRKAASLGPVRRSWRLILLGLVFSRGPSTPGAQMAPGAAPGKTKTKVPQTKMVDLTSESQGGCHKAHERLMKGPVCETNPSNSCHRLYYLYFYMGLNRLYTLSHTTHVGPPLLGALKPITLMQENISGLHPQFLVVCSSGFSNHHATACFELSPTVLRLQLYGVC